MKFGRKGLIACLIFWTFLIIAFSWLYTPAESAYVKRWVDNRLTTGANNGTSPADAWRTLEDARAGLASAGTVDYVEFVAGSGPYREAFSSTFTAIRTDLSFDATDNSINSTSTNLSSFSFTQGAKVRIQGSQLNDRQLEIATIGANKITFISSNRVYTEAAGARINVVSLTTGGDLSALNPSNNGSIGRVRIWNGNYSEIDAGVTVTAAQGLKFVQSAARPAEWYVLRTDNSNPSLIAPSAPSAVIDGYYVGDSADGSADVGTVGALTPIVCVAETEACTGQPMGYGNNDSLGFSTWYIYSPGVDPNTKVVRIGQVNAGIMSPARYHSFERFIFSFGVSGALNRSVVGEWYIKQCVFMYQGTNGPQMSGASGYLWVEGTVTYFAGHRGYTIGSEGTLILRNNTDFGSHMFLLIGNGLTSASNVIVWNNISSYNEAGFIDKKSSGVVLLEDYNRMWPRFNASGTALGYVSTANWTTTGAHSIPANAATTINTRAALIAVGGSEPQFVSASPIRFNPSDYKLKVTDPSRYAGRPVPFSRDFYNRPFHATNPTMGAHEFGPGDERGN